MNDNFLLSDLKIEKKGEKLVVRGTAAVANKLHAHAYTVDKKKSFRSYFTDKALRKMESDLKYRPVFIDIQHNITTKLNNDLIIEKILEQYPELKDELKTIQSNLTMSDVPMFILTNHQLNDDELIVEVESNPLYKEIDENHAKMYNVVTESILNQAINGFSVDFVSKDVYNENGVQKIDDLDLLGISLVNSPAMGSYTSIAEVATRSIQRIVETRTGEQKMTETGEKVVPQVNVEEVVAKKVEEALKQRELEAQKSRQEAETAKLKEELEQLKREKEAQISSGSRGVPKTEPKMSFDEFKTRLNNLSESDQIRLYAEFVTNNNTQSIPPLLKTASHRGRPDDPRVTWGFEAPSGSMAEAYRQAIRAKDDMRF